MAQVRITKRGLKAAKAGLDGLRPELVPLAEIMIRIKHATSENVEEMVQQLIARYGSIDAAMVAIRSGEVGFVKDEA